MSELEMPESALLHRAVATLLECNPVKKAAQTHELAKDWKNGAVRLCVNKAPLPPRRPGRPANLHMVSPGKVPRRRIGTPEGRIALIHAIAHIELNAIDLALDMVARFTPCLAKEDHTRFVDDWLEVADDEARHFTMLSQRLAELGSAYGELAVHQGLWEAAQNTSDDLSARLAIAPMVLEARGLDVTPPMIEKLQSAADHKSAAVLKIIFEEEISHVAKGVDWFNHVCAAKGQNPHDRFRALVQERLPTALRPPFNHKARERAGLDAGYYQGFVS